MMKKIIISVLSLSSISFVSIDAKTDNSCQGLSSGIYDSCNPYKFNFIRVEKINYQKKKKVVAGKTQPKQNKSHNMNSSIPDLIEKYIEVKEPIRYQGEELYFDEPIQLDVNSKDIDYYISLAKKLNDPVTLIISKMIKEEEKRFKQQQIIIKEYKYQQALHTLKKEKKKKRKKPKIKYGYYKVKSGDTLSHIAYMFGISSRKLARLNHISRKKHIKVNQKLILPYTQEKIDAISNAKHKVKSGDNLYSIAKKYGLSVSDLKKFNNYKKGKLLRIGEIVKLPLPYKLAQLEREAKLKEEARKKRLEQEKVRKYKNFGKHHLRVTATAYTSHRGQTDSTPFLAAWNNRLRPGMKIIAVSRDLLYKYGMKNGTKVKISGLKGYYRVRDKMNKRYKKRIDIYMGTNRRKALRWGRRSVVIHWE